jgi:regulator of replication initiation timing
MRTAGAPNGCEDGYDKVERVRREVVMRISRWKLRCDMEMEVLRGENEKLKEALAAEAAISAKLRLENKNLRAELSVGTEPQQPVTPTGRRNKHATENGRSMGVSLWNNTDEEKEKIFAVLKEKGGRG